MRIENRDGLIEFTWTRIDAEFQEAAALFALHCLSFRLCCPPPEAQQKLMDDACNDFHQRFMDEMKANTAKPPPPSVVSGTFPTATLGDVVSGIFPSATSGGGVTFVPNHDNILDTDEAMFINVKKLDGDFLILNVPADGARVIDVKRLVDGAPWQQQLFFGDMLLDNCNMKLSDLGIGAGSTLEMRAFPNPVRTAAKAQLREAAASMYLNVKKLDGGDLFLKVQMNVAKVFEVKMEIWRILQIETFHQYLFFGDMLLEKGDDKLIDLGVIDGSVIKMRALGDPVLASALAFPKGAAASSASGAPFRKKPLVLITINVKPPSSSRWYPIKTSNRADVEHFKRMIYWEVAGVGLTEENKDDFSLLLGRKRLMLGTTLEQNGVTDHSSVYMVARFQGGMDRPPPVNRPTGAGVVSGIFPMATSAEVVSGSFPMAIDQSAAAETMVVLTPAAMQMRLDRLEAQMGALPLRRRRPW